MPQQSSNKNVHDQKLHVFVAENEAILSGAIQADAKIVVVERSVITAANSPPGRAC